MRTVKIIALVLVGFFLSVSHVALAQSLFEANDLDQQVIQLYNQGRFSDALQLAQRALTIREKALGPDHPDLAIRSTASGSLYQS